AVSVAGTAAAGALSYNHAGGEILHAGSYTLSVTAAATQDYTAATLSVPFPVRQATPTVVVNPVSVTYDGQAHGTTAEAFGVGGIDLGPAVVSYSGGSAPVSAGSYTATGFFAGTQDYTSATGTAPVIITP